VISAAVGVMLVRRIWQPRMPSIEVSCSILTFIFVALSATNAAASGLIQDIGCPGGFQGEQIAGSASTRKAKGLGSVSVRRLTIYSFLSAPLLGPTGWRCLGMGGSGGEGLAIAPTVVDLQAVKDLHGGIASQVVWKYDFDRGASGRFDVARFAGRYFPNAIPKNVEGVVAEGFMPREELLGPAYSHDLLTCKSTRVLDRPFEGVPSGLREQSAARNNPEHAVPRWRRASGGEAAMADGAAACPPYDGNFRATSLRMYASRSAPSSSSAAK
jgi:hypothetical protein